MKLKLFRVILLIMLLALSIACQIDLGGPQSTNPTIPVSDAAADSLEQIVQSSIQTDSGKNIIIFTLTEEQLTSYLSRELQSRPDVPFSDPQIYLKDGYIDFYARLQQSVFTINSHLILNVNVDGQGNPTFQIVNADFGPAPLPSDLIENINIILNESLTTSITTIATGYKVQSIQISDGMITVVANKL